MRDLQATYYPESDKVLIYWEGKKVLGRRDVSKYSNIKGLSKEEIEELILSENRDLAEEIINDFSFEFEQ